MKKEEILNNLKSFVDAENELAIKEAKHLIKVFNALLDNELTSYNQLENSEQKESSTDPMKEEMNIAILEVIAKFNSNRKKKEEALKKNEEENLIKKKNLLKELESLIQTKENIGSLISGIRNIRQQWSETGSIPREKHQAIQSKFSKLNDEFNYNINIYKELKENDLKINFSLKNQIIHELNDLKNEANIKQLDNKLRSLQNKWEEIGPTFKEHWEDLKSNYWENIHFLYEKIKKHYKDLKSNQTENLERKKQLIEEISALVKTLPTNHKEWEKTTSKIKSIQEKWKSIGPVPKKENDKIWKEFRGFCDDFFDNKKAFYNEQNQSYKQNANLKSNLIKELETALNFNDFKKTVDEIKKLQIKWKKIGHAGRHLEQKLWHNFRTKCDEFFEKKDKENKAKKEEENKSLIEKKAIIDEIKKIDPKSESAKETFYSLIEKFKTTGKSSYSKSKQLHDELKGLIIKKLKGLNLSSKDKENLLSQLKIHQINDSFNPEKTLQNEREKIKKQINHIMKEVLNYENNLGFFSNSSGNSSILKNVTDNIEKGKKEIEKLKAELKKLKL